LPEFRIGEDRLFILMALKANFTLAFIDNIHVLYNVHDENISDTSAGDERFDRRIVAMHRLLESYEQAEKYVHLNKKEHRNLHKRLALDYFWKLGYSLQQQAGYYSDALYSYKKAIKLYPFSFKFWKTYCVNLFKYKINKITPLHNKSKLLVLGDSHTETFKCNALQKCFPKYYFNVVAVGGATVSGLQNPNSKTQALPIFEKNIAEFKPNKIIIQLGEVDTGFVIWYRAEKYKVSVDEMLIKTIDSYTNLLSSLKSKADVICIGTVLPTIKDGQDWGEIANARKEIKATQRERTSI
jgi:tetratricopeptide (TPR) repeat protein